jgi:hypothetical protein
MLLLEGLMTNPQTITTLFHHGDQGLKTMESPGDQDDVICKEESTKNHSPKLITHIRLGEVRTNLRDVEGKEKRRQRTSLAQSPTQEDRPCRNTINHRIHTVVTVESFQTTKKFSTKAQGGKFSPKNTPVDGVVRLRDIYVTKMKTILVRLGLLLRQK